MYKIITNNTLVKTKFENAIYVDGDFRDVLITTRDFIHTGSSLVQHPLPASIRMLYSPIRSIIIKEDSGSEHSVLTIETAIEKYDKTMGIRKPDYKNTTDYIDMDYSMLQSALAELF